MHYDFSIVFEFGVVQVADTLAREGLGGASGRTHFSIAVCFLQLPTFIIVLGLQSSSLHYPTHNPPFVRDGGTAFKDARLFARASGSVDEHLQLCLSTHLLHI